MDEIKRITKEKLLEIATIKGFGSPILEKDYLLTELLYLIKDVEGLYSKRGKGEVEKEYLTHLILSPLGG